MDRERGHKFPHGLRRVHVRLKGFDGRQATAAIALGLFAAMAACSGDDNGSAGGGGSGGRAGGDAARGGGGLDAAGDRPDTSTDRSVGGAGGTGGGGTGGAPTVDVSVDRGRDGSVEADVSAGSGGSGGSDAGPDARPDVIDAAPEAPRPDAEAGPVDVIVSSDVPDSTPTSDVVDAVSSDVRDAAPEVTPDVAPDTREAASDAGTSVLFPFDFTDSGTYDWATEGGTLALVPDGAPENPNGALEWSALFPLGRTEVSAFIEYGLTGGFSDTRTDLGDVTQVHISVRLRNPAALQNASVANITAFVLGGLASGYGISQAQTLFPGDAFFNGDWVTLDISVGNSGNDSGIRDIADLWRISVTLRLNNPDAAPVAPIVVDIDNVTVTR
jgi:hypothetical protein